MADSLHRLHRSGASDLGRGGDGDGHRHLLLRSSVLSAGFADRFVATWVTQLFFGMGGWGKAKLNHGHARLMLVIIQALRWFYLVSWGF